MQSALDSVKKRIEVSGEDDKELVADLETRLQELEQANESVTSDEKRAVIEGILGADAAGSSSSTAASTAAAPSPASSTPSSILKEAVLNSLGQANDISSLVRKRPDKKRATPTVSTDEPSSKRAKEE
ncbi:hypothetical protein AWJ20_4486 [Sugiyamaella lignohabitans]|uniref:Uncharacterized protein n=1 Tax=Sugiyamaella lignohabitans TaxID=796027 RepID=A0A167CGN1_9ASCO|nr:uncharacterized protein AWJ20_4486 [Sugiyamaella lignohabitans]ANB11665.1 hypothetical protein AWJ20_4486 [Sugiyamaella lignohabitans]